MRFVGPENYQDVCCFRLERCLFSRSCVLSVRLRFFCNVQPFVLFVFAGAWPSKSGAGGRSQATPGGRTAVILRNFVS